MNKVQASAYCDILREGLNTIVAVNLSIDWQQQIAKIYTETTKALDCIPRFTYRIIESEGVLFVDDRSIENEIPSDVVDEFRSLIRAYSILVSTTRYPDNIQFITKRTKVVQMLNKTQSAIRTENRAMAVNVRNRIIFDLSRKTHQPYITFLKQAIGFRRSGVTRTLAIMHDRGRKSDYIQTYEYEVNQVRLLVDTYKDTGKWFHVFDIDKGSNDGIKVGMNVMAGDGLVGIVTEVGHNYATVRSIIDDQSNVSAMFLKTTDTCNVKGSLELIDDGVIELELIDKNAEIQKGYEVVTSRISDKYLPGILIGYVQDVNVDPNNLTQSGTLVPAVDFSSLDMVLVVTQLKESNY